MNSARLFPYDSFPVVCLLSPRYLCQGQDWLLLPGLWATCTEDTRSSPGGPSRARLEVASLPSEMQLQPVPAEGEELPLQARCLPLLPATTAQFWPSPLRETLLWSCSCLRASFTGPAACVQSTLQGKWLLPSQCRSRLPGLPWPGCVSRKAVTFQVHGSQGEAGVMVPLVPGRARGAWWVWEVSKEACFSPETEEEVPSSPSQSNPMSSRAPPSLLPAGE